MPTKQQHSEQTLVSWPHLVQQDHMMHIGPERALHRFILPEEEAVKQWKLFVPDH